MTELTKIPVTFNIVTKSNDFASTINVAAFRAGPYSFAGGSLRIMPSGTWYVGPDLFTKSLIALSRLGHRGFIPIAKVITDANGVTKIDQITPVLPTCRIPRTTEKLLKQEKIKVVVMGSSLAEGGGVETWGGMIGNHDSNASDYRIPGQFDFANIGLGGSPNQFQFAQLGIGSFNSSNIDKGGAAGILTDKVPPNGRSPYFNDVDLVIITMLANGGDARLECIEPIIRQLRKRNIEVIVTTDEAINQPFANYDALVNAGLYRDGPTLMNIADLYGCEIADTAAYMADAYFRYGPQMYRDAIHPSPALPAGRTKAPSCGYEIWARAVRSCIPVDSTFDTREYNAANHFDGVRAETGSLQYTNDAVTNSNQEAFVLDLPQYMHVGDAIRVRGSITGLNGSYSGHFQVNDDARLFIDFRGNFDWTFYAKSPGKLFYIGSNQPGGVSLKDVTIEFISKPYEIITGREKEAQRLPQIRKLNNSTAPGDAFVILPKDEYYMRNNSGDKGALVSTSTGYKFAKFFSPSTPDNQSALLVSAGQRASIGANGAVNFSFVMVQTPNAPAITFDVYRFNTKLKTMTIPATNSTASNNPVFYTVLATDELKKTDSSPDFDAIDIRVTSGTLEIVALVALTFDMDYIRPEEINYVGTWAGHVDGGQGMMGYGSDKSGDYAFVKCPQYGNCLSWVISGKPNSKPVDTWSGQTIKTNETTTGVNHVFVIGDHVGPDEYHYIKLDQDQTDATHANGYGLHIGGAIIVNDR